MDCATNCLIQRRAKRLNHSNFSFLAQEEDIRNAETIHELTLRDREERLSHSFFQASLVLALVRRSDVLSLENASSMRKRAGEYPGKKRS